MGPERPGPGRAPSPILPGQGHHRLGLLLAFVVLIAIAALVAYLVVRLANRRPPATSFAPVGGPMPLAQDDALATLRLRYARGEVSRSDYLQAAADLGAPNPLPHTPPNTAPPP